MSSVGFASTVYVNSNPSRVQQAIINVYGASAGVGVTGNACTLCHNTTAGGPGNINANFGTEFVAAAGRVGATFNGGGSQTLSVLQNILSDATLQAADSDSDGSTNQAEFLANTDPSGNDTNPSTGGAGGDGGGGCGMIGGGPGSMPPTSGLFLLLLPLALVFGLRQRKLLSPA